MKDTTDLLIRHLGDARDNAFTNKCYNLIPTSRFQILGSFEGPFGKRALFIKPNIAGEADFETLAETVFRKDCGIAIVGQEWQGGMPDILLNYGALWAFTEYGHLAGNAQMMSEYERAAKLDPEDPFAAIREVTNDVEMGMPSEEIFPPYVREKITADLQESFPGTAVGFTLMDCRRYIMGKRIAVSLQSPQELPRQEIQERLDWYAPPFLPVLLA